MAQDIPNQNHLNDIIKSISEQLDNARMQLKEYNARRKKSSVDLRVSMTHMRTDFQSIIEFLDMFSDKDLEKTTQSIQAVLGFSAKLSNEISNAKIEPIDEIKLFTIQNSISALSRFVKSFNKSKINPIDTDKVECVMEVLNELFDDGGIAYTLTSVGNKLNDLSHGIILKFTILKYSISALADLTTVLVTFGIKAGILRRVIQFAHGGVAQITLIVGELATLIDRLYSIKQLKGGIRKMFGPHKRILLLKLILNSLVKLVLPMIKLGLVSYAIKWFKKSVPEYVEVINEIAELIETVSKLGMSKLLLAPLRVKLINSFITSLAQMVWSMLILAAVPTKVFASAKNSMVEIAGLLTSIKDSFNVIRSFGIVELVLSTIKIALLDLALSAIVSLMLYIGAVSYLLKLVIPGLTALENALVYFHRAIKFVDDNFKARFILSTSIKCILIRGLIKRLVRVMYALMILAFVGYLIIPLFSGLLMAELAITTFSQIVSVINHTKMGLFFQMKLGRMIKAARLLRVLLRSIINLTYMRGLRKATAKMILILILVKAFAMTVATVMTMSVLLILFIVLSPIIVLSIVAFGLVLIIITKIVEKTIGPKSLIAIALLAITLTALVVVGAALLVLALIAPAIVANALNIILFFGVVIAATLALAAIGFIAASMSSYLAPALYGIGLVTAMIFAVFAMAVMLRIIQTIELDEDKIKENVRKVIGTVLFIITSLFETELSDPEGKDNAFTKILKTIGGVVAKILLAIATCVILIATFVSVACILMIATMLRMLQNLNLNPDKILSNVDMVFDTVDKILNRFMQDEPEGKKTNHGILLSVVKWLNPGDVKVFEALMSMAYLFLMFMSVMMVLGIAKMLENIQKLKLDTATIRANVDEIFNTVDQIIDKIFGPRDDKQTSSKRGILLRIISWADKGLAGIIEAALSVVYLALIMLSVGLVLAIAGMLKLIGKLELNAKKITDCVDTIFDVADLIINRVFGDRKDPEHPSKRGMLVTIVSWVNPGLAKVVEAALSVVYLSLALISITIVLGIASLLKQIEGMDLDSEAIKGQIDAVFDVVDKLIERVFAPAKDDIIPGHGFVGKIIGFFMPGVAKIVDALLAVGQLSMIFLAISIVKGIAENLDLISQIPFDKAKAIKQVNDIFEAVGSIMDIIYEKADSTLPEPKDKGIFSSIIGFFSPGLGDILDALTMIAKLALVQTAISAVVGIGQALKQIEDIDVNLDKAGIKTDTILNMAATLCERIFSTEADIKFPTPPEDRKSVFGALISWAFGGKSEEDKALEMAMKRVETLGIIEAAVGVLGNILEASKRIMDMNISDLAGAKAKVADVMDMAVELSQAIFGADVKLTLPEPSNDEVGQALVDLGLDHWWRSSTAGEIADAKAQAAMKLAMHRVETLGIIASAVGSVASIIDGVGKIQDYKLPDMNGINNKVRQIMQASANISTIIFDQDGVDGFVDAKAKIEDIRSRIEYTGTGVDGVTDLGERIAKLIEKTKFTEDQVISTRNRFTTAVTAIGEIMAQMDAINPDAGGETIRNNCDLMDRISKTVGSFVKVDAEDVKNSKNITENYIKFFRQVDSMDLKKLQHTDWLMRSWASISRDLKGDFEGLAKTINQHIMPMLEKVNETLDKTTKAQQDIIKIMSQPVDLDTNNNAAQMPPNTPPAQQATTPPAQQATNFNKTENGSTKRTEKDIPDLTTGAQNVGNIEPGKKYVVKFMEVKDY